MLRHNDGSVADWRCSALANLGYEVGRNTIKRTIREHGIRVSRVQTAAQVTLEAQGGAFSRNKGALGCDRRGPGASPDQFKKIADDTEANCPISKLLKAEITLDVKLAQPP